MQIMANWMRFKHLLGKKEIVGGRSFVPYRPNFATAQQLEQTEDAINAERKALTEHNPRRSWPYFVQPGPVWGNQFQEDGPLNHYLQRIVPLEVLEEWRGDLEQFGARLSSDGDLWQLHRQCEEEPPRLTQTDSWGARVSRLQTCSAWKEMHNIAAREGLISIAYEGRFGEWARIYQMVKNYLFAPSSGLYSCPLAMTDGAAKILRHLLSVSDSATAKDRFNKAFNRLTTRQADLFWTSGQWMTERRGGSDVANGTETVAVPMLGADEVTYRLYGYKWFSSATDADMGLTLARVTDEAGNVRPGGEGLSLFYVETRGEDGQLNEIEMVKLKNKLGTRQLPTAELILDGTVATLASSPGRGVAAIANMLLMTRIHNSVSAVAAMRRIWAMARGYASVRSAFGKKLMQHPLHVQTLAGMDLEIRASLLLLLETCRLLGRDENGLASEEEQLRLRILTPILKLFTAKQAMAVVSEGIECFGGQGYMEETGIPNILRDAQVLPIWEGTTNILSLDMLRSILKSQGATLKALFQDCRDRTQTAQTHDYLALQTIITTLENFAYFRKSDPLAMQLCARDFAMALAQTYAGCLLVEQASLSKDAVDADVARRWCSQMLGWIVARFTDTQQYTSLQSDRDYCLVMDGLNSS